MNSGDRKEEDTTDGDTITIDKPRKREASRAWGILLFAVIGATATVAAVSHLRRSFDWFCTQERIRRMQNIFNRERDKVKRSYESWREHGHDPYQHYHDAQHDGWHWKAGTSYKDQKADARNTSRDNGIMSHHYSVLGLDGSYLIEKPYDFEINTSYVKGLTVAKFVSPTSSLKSKIFNSEERDPGKERLGLSRVKPYTDAEIKICSFDEDNFKFVFLPTATTPLTYIRTAFRAKAMEYHPDQNKENTELAEIKFKEVMRSYEAIKLERKNKSEE